MSEKSTDTTEHIVSMLRERDGLSLTKYKGKTMDRTDLTASEWATHSIEEKLDDIKYMVRANQGLVLLEEARKLLGMVSWSPSVQDWLKRHDEILPPPT